MDYMKNNRCLHYEHQDGAPEPKTRDSCRGCKYSYDPKMYDPGCLHPDQFVPRDPKERKKQLQKDIHQRGISLEAER